MGSGRRLWRELAASGPGRAGLALLAVLTLASIYVLVAYPSDFGTARWANPAYWADYPKAVPPAWTNLLTAARRAQHQVLEAQAPARAETLREGAAYTKVYEFPFVHDAGEPPTFLSVSVAQVEYRTRPPVISVSLVRPDGREVTLLRQVVNGPRPGESPPYRRHTAEPLRVLLSTEPRAAEAVRRFVSEQFGLELPAGPVAAGPRLLEAALFGVPRPRGEPPGGQAGGRTEATSPPEPAFEVLRGLYLARVSLLLANPEDSAGSVRFVVGGAVYGLMGTDALGRDLAPGLLFGLPLALAIGISTSTVSTLLGTTLGLVSGYTGGWVDTAIQRAADIVANVPVLPLLIFMVFIGGTKLWLILLVLVAFSWPGLTIVVRSMVLQLRTGEEVEAARTIGASQARVLLRHVFPHTASYILAQLVFFAPSAILAEAGLSFLGLGDPTLPTWGQVLESGFRTGAVFLGYWWWVVPPGLLIVVTAVTFMLLALGLEPAVDPRMRGGRPWRS